MGFLNTIKKLFGFGSDETTKNDEIEVVEHVEVVEPKIEDVIEEIKPSEPILVEEVKVEESETVAPTVKEIKSESKFKQKTDEPQERKKPTRRPRPKKKKTEE